MKNNTKEIRILQEDFDMLWERMYENEHDKIDLRRDIKGI